MPVAMDCGQCCGGCCGCALDPFYVQYTDCGDVFSFFDPPTETEGPYGTTCSWRINSQTGLEGPGNPCGIALIGCLPGFGNVGPCHMFDVIGPGSVVWLGSLTCYPPNTYIYNLGQPDQSTEPESLLVYSFTCVSFNNGSLPIRTWDYALPSDGIDCCGEITLPLIDYSVFGDCAEDTREAFPGVEDTCVDNCCSNTVPGYGFVKVVPFCYTPPSFAPSEEKPARREEYRQKIIADSRNRPKHDQLGQGPGTELKLMLEQLGFWTDETCRCKRRVRYMNFIGVRGCREKRDEIVGWLKGEMESQKWAKLGLAALKGMMLSGQMNLRMTDPLGSLVDEALRRAELKEMGGVDLTGVTGSGEYQQ
jgi:hypothetical protein